MKRYLRLAAYILLAIVLLTAAGLVWDGTTDDPEPADVAVVFGNTVTPEGEPSDRLRARLDRAVELYREGLAANILVSGAVGEEGVDESVVMRRWLIEQGVPAEHILADGEGANTRLTAVHTAKLARTRSWRRAIVVTQYFHVTRAKLALRQAGIDSVFGAHARFMELRDLYSLLREIVGIYSYAAQYGLK